MKLHLYTNNAYDTVALVNSNNKVISHWNADSVGGVHATALEDALHTTCASDWDDQFLSVNTDDFEEHNTLFLIIHEDGEWEVEDRELLADRLSFHLGNLHPIVQALNV